MHNSLSAKQSPPNGIARWIPASRWLLQYQRAYFRGDLVASRGEAECLAKEFGDRVNIKPIVTPGLRCAAMEFNSPLAQIVLQFSAGTDSDVTRLVLASDLDILPILMQFDQHTEISFPLDQIDSEAIAQWLDDRIVAFVKTYLSLHENEYYLKGHMVEDPIAHVRFPKFAAGATRERNGKPVYFISEVMAQEFDKQKS